MKIRQLIEGIPGLTVKGSRDIAVTGIASDSRIVSPGNLFIAKKGARSHGIDFIQEAARAGASAIVSDIYNPFFARTQILCAHPQDVEALLAARYYHFPSRDLWVAGVTGTKGKTTVSYWLKHFLDGLDRPAGLMGTIEIAFGQKRFPSAFTTHDAIRNQRTLREMVNAGCRAAVLEVSSHGLDQGRVDEVAFSAAVFTNLSADHLDYHQTWEEYARAKKKLFEKASFGIYNADSSWSAFMQGDRPGIRFGFSPDADVRGTILSEDCNGMRLAVAYQGMREIFSLPLIGDFNASNFLAALAVAAHLGTPLGAIRSLAEHLPLIPGRLEKVSQEGEVQVFVDFAHTGEALAKTLAALRKIARGKICVVFGCGGGRDPGRRKGMAAAAEAGADLAFITVDNAREEDPRLICQEIIAGFQSHEKVVLELDRKQAIQRAIEEAREDDIVLIAGKGHECFQMIGSQKTPFDDREAAREVLRRLRTPSF